MEIVFKIYRYVSFVFAGGLLLYGLVVLSVYFEDPTIPTELYEIAFVAPLFITAGLLMIYYNSQTIYFPIVNKYEPGESLPRGIRPVKYFNFVSIILIILMLLLVGWMLYFLLFIDFNSDIAWMCTLIGVLAWLQVAYIRLMQKQYERIF